jgi:hypothetical protein
MARTLFFPRALGVVTAAISLLASGCGSTSHPRQLSPHAKAVLERHIAEARSAMGLGDQAGAQNALAALADDIQVLGARHAADPSQLALLSLEVGQARARVALDVHATPIAQPVAPATAPAGATGEATTGAQGSPSPPGLIPGTAPGPDRGKAKGDKGPNGPGQGAGHGHKGGGSGAD